MKSELTVIFSAVRRPEETVVHNSLLRFVDFDSVKVITSARFSKFWLKFGYQVQVARFDSTSILRVLARKFLLRSSLLRKMSRLLLLGLRKNVRQVLMPPHNARHFEYLKVLESMNRDDWALLVDSRDLVFQIHPREILNCVDTQFPVHLFLEDGKFFKDGKVQLNDKSMANWNWASQVLNHDLAKLACLENTKIVNSGCILGKVDQLIGLFEESCNLMANSLYSSFALLDQAALNVIAYTSEFNSKIQMHKNGEVVLNMCGVIEETVGLEDGQIHRANQAIPIVHQFDRFGGWNIDHGFRFDKREYRVQ